MPQLWGGVSGDEKHAEVGGERRLRPVRVQASRAQGKTATLPVSPIRLTDRAERLALVSSTQRTAIEALRSTPAGTRWAVQLRRTIVHISLFAAQLLRDGL